MNKNISLTNFINEQIMRFNIQNNKKNFLKLRQKCQRELKNLGIWENPAEIKLVDKSKTKFFNQSQLNLLYSNIEPYLLKISNVNLKDLQEYRAKISKYNDYIKSDEYINYMNKYNYDPNPYEATITKDMKLEFMIEALFNKFFEPINEEQWKKDLELELVVDDIDEDWAGSLDTYNARKRLQNKLTSYTKEKK